MSVGKVPESAFHPAWNAARFVQFWIEAGKVELKLLLL